MNLNTTKDRHKYVGGSDLPAILNYNLKYGRSVFDFAQTITGITHSDFKGNEHTRYGQLMEPIIRDYINKKYDHHFVEATSLQEEKGQRANADGVDDTDYLLEVKTHTKELDIDHYTPQCQFYMEHFNKNYCMLVGYQKPNDFYNGLDYELENDDSYFNLAFDPTRLTIIILERDRSYYQMLDKIICKFQKCLRLVKNNPSMSEEEFNTLFYGKDFINLIEELNHLELKMVEIRDLEKNYKQIKEQLYLEFENRKLFRFDTGLVKINKIDRRVDNNKIIDIEKLIKDYPMIYEKCRIDKKRERKGYLYISPIRNGETYDNIAS